MTATVRPSRAVRCQVGAGIARVMIDRPPVNALTIEMLDDLGVALATVRADPTVRCLLLTGAGKCFCAGVDVAEHTADRAEAMLTRYHAVLRSLRALEMPTVAAVHGATVGGGLGLALACDVVLAQEDARLGQPEIKLGLFPPAAAALLSRFIGRQRALDLIFTGRALKAREALAIGLVSEVSEADRFAADVAAYVARLVSYSGPVLRLAKRAVNEALEMGPEVGLVNAERLYVRDLLSLEDAHEGVAAWIAKRAPVWRDA